ncbi:MAG: FkbM family methyltransferase [Chloroflexota bacterium]|nr:FkbM family methyltransferase [Chloroflexota bacterium]
MRKVRLLGRLGELDKIDRLLEAIGRVEARQLEHDGGGRLDRHGFTVYSQHGEDGILQHLIRNVAVASRTFVEFGVGNYRQANTRFLAINDHWSGLVMDSDADSVRQIQTDPIFWSINVRAVHAFVTRENIDSLLQANGLVGDIGLLSIDIDGNDYWVLEAISSVRPALMVVEYNSRFGPERAVSVPYDPAFNRWMAHPSGVYFGASLRAIVNLARRKGYAFVGCNSFGVNAFFVRSDLLTGNVSSVTVEEGFVAGQFREARDRNGRLAFLEPAEEQAILATMPLVEFNETGDLA